MRSTFRLTDSAGASGSSSVTDTRRGLHTRLRLQALSAFKQRYFPGVCVTVTVAIAASFLSQRYGAPAMLIALLLGLAFNFLREHPACLPGVEFSTGPLLRIGVALLGLRIAIGDVQALGWQTVFGVCLAVLSTLAFGVLIARAFGFSRWFGALTGGSVAICGASAAVAISTVLPPGKTSQRDTLFVVIAVTTLSTVAMVVYPTLCQSLGFSSHQAGIFLGGAIHDVAQVVGAGYSFSPEAGDLATFVKLLRVAMLAPVVLAMGIAARIFAHNRRAGRASAAPPVFLLGFVALFVLNSLGLVPATIREALSAAASWLLLTAVAALGVRTSLQEVLTLGWRPLVLILSESVFLGLLAVAGVLLM